MKDRKYTSAVVNDSISGFQNLQPGATIEIEDLWQNVYGMSWMDSVGNPAAMGYGVRSAMAGLPLDNKVWYGKIGGLGYLVHESELL